MIGMVESPKKPLNPEEVLRRMLNTPPNPRAAKKKKKKK